MGDEHMPSEISHPTEQELLMVADGELSIRRATQVRVHLATCRECCVRMREIEEQLSDFVQSHRRILDLQLPPIACSRAQLRAQLAGLTASSQQGFWCRFLPFTETARIAVCLCVCAFVAAVVAEHLFQPYLLRGRNSALVSSVPDVVPNPSLTPGATRRITISDVCSMPHEEVVKEVPSLLRRKVFQEYGIANADVNDYEVDYLITPGLGGTEDIHNLWPDPYHVPTWNAHVKDALEEHLHQLVCSGKLDLPTAQHDIATNWIAAYKKYFHTNKPLPLDPRRARLLGVAFALLVSPERMLN